MQICCSNASLIRHVTFTKMLVITLTGLQTVVEQTVLGLGLIMIIHKEMKTVQNLFYSFAGMQCWVQNPDLKHVLL